MPIVRSKEYYDHELKNRTRPESGLYYVIPSFVFECEELEHSEIVFFALLSGLANRHGYCFASDEYLAERIRVEGRTIRKWLLKLERLNFLERKTGKNGMYWNRKIYVFPANSKNSYERPYSSGSRGPTVPDREAPQVRIESEEKRVSKETSSSKPSSKSTPPSPPPTPREEEEPSQEEVEEIDRRHRSSIEYHKSKGTRPPIKSPAWVRKTLASIRQERVLKPLESNIAASKLYAQQHASKVNQIASKRTLIIDLLNSYVEVSEPGSSFVDCIPYLDPDFKRKFDEAVEKRMSS